MMYSDDEIEGIISQLDEMEASFTTDGMRPFHALDNARTALRHLLEESRERRTWRLPEHAPDDGTPVLVWCAHDFSDRQVAVCWQVKGRWLGGQAAIPGFVVYSWMPLPPLAFMPCPHVTTETHHGLP